MDKVGEVPDRYLSDEQRLMRQTWRRYVDEVVRHFRDAAVYLHMDATADVSNFKIARALFPATAGTYAGPE